MLPKHSRPASSRAAFLFLTNTNINIINKYYSIFLRPVLNSKPQGGETMQEDGAKLMAMAIQNFYSLPDEKTLHAAIDVARLYCRKETAQEVEQALRQHLQLIQNGSLSPGQA
ncbi:hypothetical protein KKH39_02155 [Patescibacteria group bacterium]|nr:hypothetical protein [Patescibacteria group bacterium]